MEDQIDEVQKNIDVLAQKKIELSSKKDYLGAGNKDKKASTSTSTKNRGAAMSAKKAAEAAEGETSQASKNGEKDTRTQSINVIEIFKEQEERVALEKK
jgi:hypothetical protein